MGPIYRSSGSDSPKPFTTPPPGGPVAPPALPAAHRCLPTHSPAFLRKTLRLEVPRTQRGHAAVRMAPPSGARLAAPHRAPGGFCLPPSHPGQGCRRPPPSRRGRQGGTGGRARLRPARGMDPGPAELSPYSVGAGSGWKAKCAAARRGAPGSGARRPQSPAGSAARSARPAAIAAMPGPPPPAGSKEAGSRAGLPLASAASARANQRRLRRGWRSGREGVLLRVREARDSSVRAP